MSILTELAILCMCPYPAYKKMHLTFSKGVFADHPVIISPEIENYPV